MHQRVFHCSSQTNFLLQVNTYIFELIDYIILFKTNDNEKLIHDKFKDNEQLIEFYNTVNQSDNFFEHKLFKNS